MVLKLLARLEGLCFTVGIYVGLLTSPTLAIAAPRHEVGPPPGFPLVQQRRAAGDRRVMSAEGSRHRQERSSPPHYGGDNDTDVDYDVSEDDDYSVCDTDSLFVAQIPWRLQSRQEKLRRATDEAILRLEAYTKYREPVPDPSTRAPAVAAALFLLGERKAWPGPILITGVISRAMVEFATYCTGTTAAVFQSRLEAFRESWRAAFHLAAASRVPSISITGTPWSLGAVSATFSASGQLRAPDLMVRGGRRVALSEEPEHYIGCLAYSAFQQSGFLDVLSETALNHHLHLEAIGIVPHPNITFEEWILPRLLTLQSTASRSERFGRQYDPLHIILGIGEESGRGLSVGEVFIETKAHRLVELAHNASSAATRQGRTAYRVKLPSPERLKAADAHIQLSSGAGWDFQHASNSKIHSVHSELAEPEMTTLQYVLMHHAWHSLRALFVAILMRVLARTVLHSHRAQVNVAQEGQWDARTRPNTPSTQAPNDTTSDISSIFDTGLDDISGLSSSSSS
eukprot:Blabericola_migrator_1__568@NODE_1140_length_5303_cov_96_490451_g776_i0_p1_GENE_NODE_1140_length_5303_cov_96_490451_g776_i0NODE_1140_length_5303_cov_96_490451_g776_i0_p1_ORF_typecomplete_len513_score59_06_NODE_1140_length_5303_cov_96_490451_g776_i0831621